MSTLLRRLSIVALGLAALATPSSSVRAQYDRSSDPYDQRAARPRHLAALLDDLRVLDESLSLLPPGHRRREEFQRRSDEIRSEVVSLADDISRYREGRADVGGSRADVA